jgi:PAS domain S-box-containing protein
MVEVSPDTLQEQLMDLYGYVPYDFLDNLSEGKYLVYIASCRENSLIFMEPSPELFTGFTMNEIIAGGIDLQISRIHPEDLPAVYDKALQVLQWNAAALEQGEETMPLVTEFRMRRADGEWRDVQETKIYRYFDDGSRDRLLGKIVDITERKNAERSDTQEFIGDIRNEYPLLSSLQKFKKGTEKQPIHPTADVSSSIPAGIGLLTKREKELLQLIGSGLSTKQIAAKLFISINTVQSHRNNLLKKLQVKNSVELIREASKAFWL